MMHLRRLVRWPNTAEARHEAAALVAAGIVFLLFLIPALGFARSEYHDGVRRTLLRGIKVELEHWFNERNGFPAHPSGALRGCGSSDDPDDWFFSDVLIRERHRPELARGPLQTSGFTLRYCPTMLGPAVEGAPPQTAGFFLESRLENRRPDQAGFNPEYNMFERTLQDGPRTLFRLCGGTETQCGT